MRYRILYVFVLALVMAKGKCERMSNNNGDGEKSSALDNTVKPGEEVVTVNNKEDEQQKKLAVYREGLLNELLKGFEREKPIDVIEENKRSFINYIKGKKWDGFHFPLGYRLLSFFISGVYSFWVNKTVGDLLVKERFCNMDASFREKYKKNQKIIDNYDRFVAIKYFLSRFLNDYSSSDISMKNCGENFKKIDNVRRLRNDERDSVISDVGFRLYLYECMSKMRISPQEACEKLQCVSEDDVQLIMEILDELQTDEEIFMRNFYDNTSILQRYGLEDYTTYESGDRWQFSNMLFTIGGSIGSEAGEISLQSIKPMTILERCFSVLLPIGLFLIGLFALMSDTSFMRGKSGVSLCYYLAVFSFFNAFFTILCSSRFFHGVLSLVIWFLFCIGFTWVGGTCNDPDSDPHSKAIRLVLTTSILGFLFLIFNCEEYFSYFRSLFFYDTNTCVTEYLIAKRNDSISRYIKSLLSLYYLISKNSILSEVFANEIRFFNVVCMGTGGSNESEKEFFKNILICINYFRRRQNPSVAEVLSQCFNTNYSNITFTNILYAVQEFLVAFAFNAAKIRANLKLFKDSDLRTTVISALK